MPIVCAVASAEGKPSRCVAWNTVGGIAETPNATSAILTNRRSGHQPPATSTTVSARLNAPTSLVRCSLYSGSSATQACPAPGKSA